jgi:ATP-dependent Clp protease ATP-binding subunit ClpC
MRLKRLIAAGLAAVLLFDVPGIPCYQALAASSISVGRGAVPDIQLGLPGPSASGAPGLMPVLPELPALSASLAPAPAAPLVAPVAVAAAAAAAVQPAAVQAQLQAAGAQLDAVKPGAVANPAAQAGVIDRIYSGSKANDGEAAAVAAPEAAPELATQVVDASPWAGLARRLAKTFSALPLDRARAEARGRRWRAAAELELRPDASGVLRIRATPGSTFRSADAAARLPAVSAAVVNDPEFRAVVSGLFARLPEEVRRRGVRVGLHQMRVADGEVVPEGAHQDPFTDYIATWAVKRSNAAGGASALYAAKGAAPVFEKELDSSEILLFDNRALWHDVSALTRSKARKGAATRDVLVFAFTALPSAPALAPADRAAAAAAASEEFAKREPDAARLKSLYVTGDWDLQKLLFQGFKRWSRYFSREGRLRSESWLFLKSASAPWAGHVYKEKLKSVLEFLNEAHGGQQDAEQKAAEIHAADHAFADAFVAAAEKKRPQGLDAAEAADAISDSVLYPLVIEPFMQRRQKGKFNRKALIGDVAQRLKDTVFLYNPISLSEIQVLLQDPGVLARLDHFIDLVEAQMPDNPRPPPSAAAGGQSRQGKGRAAGGTMAALAFLAFGAAWHFVTGGDASHLAWLGAGIGMIGALKPGRQPEAPQQPARDADDEKPAGEELSPYLIDLTQMARRGEIPPIYLRDDETAKTIQVLNQKNYNNVILIGEPGVGKTAIAEGLAQRIAAGKTGTPLDTQRVLLLEIGKFMAAAGGSPDAFAAAVEEVVREAADGNTVLVIDEAHQLARNPDMPNANGSFFDQIKRVMTQGKLKLILATTRDEYNRFFASDRALESRSQVLYVDPVQEGPAMELVYRIRGQFEHGVTVSFAAAKASVELTVRAFRFDALLRMAIKAVDTAATRLRLRPALLRRRVLDARKDLLYHLDLLRQARAENDLERQENLVPQIDALLDKYSAHQAEILQAPRTVVGREDVAESLQELGAPVHSLKAGTQEYIDGIDALLRKNLIGHDNLITSTVAALKRRFAQPNLRKPVFSALLLGPTGTGKTEFARLMARALYGIEDVEKGVIKIDGGTHQQRHDIARIQGSPPGYVGFNATETLMDQVRRKPESIILVDEVEKMHPDILNLFLSILEDGTAKDSVGKPVDFSHVVLIFTSNFGVPADYEKMSDEEFTASVRERLKQPFPISPFKPEMLNRPDLVDVFTPLKEDEVRRIAELRLAQLRDNWKKEHGVDLAYADPEGTAGALFQEGFDRRNGARPINRVVNARLEGPLSDLLVSQKLRRGDRIVFRPDWTYEIAAGAREARIPVIASSREDSRAIASRLETLASRAEPITLDDVDAALLGEPPLPATPGLTPRAGVDEFVSDVKTEPVADHRPNASDPALKKALDALKKDAESRPGFHGEEFVKAVRALALKAKRLNLEAATRAVEGPAWERGFDEMEREAADLQGARKTAVQKTLADIVERAGKERRVDVEWQLREKTAVVRVTADSTLTYEEEDALLALFQRAAVPAEGLEKARDGALAQAQVDALAAGARLAYQKADGKTYLWLEWPIPEAAGATAAAVVEEKAPEPAPAVRPGKNVAEAALERLNQGPVVPAADAGELEPVLPPEPLALFRKAGLLLNPATSDESIERERRAIVRALDETPALATRELEESLWRGVAAYLAYLEKLRKGNNQIEAQAMSLSDGVHKPSKRFATSFELYGRLLRARPDLIPADVDAKLASAFAIGTGSGYYDQAGDKVRAWIRDEAALWVMALQEDAGWKGNPEIGNLAAQGWWKELKLSRAARVFADRRAPQARSEAAAAELAAVIEQPKTALSAHIPEAVWSVIDEHLTRVEKGGADAEPEWRTRRAFELYGRLIDLRPAEIPAALPDRIKRMLALPRPAAEWTVAQGVDLGVRLEQQKPGSAPWKELTAFLSESERWQSLLLVRHANVLLNAESTAEAVVEASNALSEELAERPQRASAALEAVLRGGVEAQKTFLETVANNRKMVDPSVVVEVGGRTVPVRRIREIFGLYAKLLAARPDLAPADLPQRLSGSLGFDRWRRFREYDGASFDERGSGMAAWVHRQLADLALLLEKKRPDLVGVPELRDIHEAVKTRRAARRGFNFWDTAAFVAVPVLVLLTAAIKYWWFEPAPWLSGHALAAAFAFGPALLALRVSSWPFLTRRDRVPYGGAEGALRERILARAQEGTPHAALLDLGAFGAESSSWGPAAGRSDEFNALLKRWPAFKAESRGGAVGLPQEGDAAKTLELAKIVVDAKAQPDAAVDAAVRLAKALAEAPAPAAVEIEALLRGSISRYQSVLEGTEKESDLNKFMIPMVSAPGPTSIPNRRVREIHELYGRLLRARPELAGDAAKAELLRAFKGAALPAVGWVQSWAAGVLAALETARPGLWTSAELKGVLDASLDAKAGALDAFRDSDWRSGLFGFAIAGTIVLAVAGVPLWLWIAAGGFWFWALGSAAALGGAVAAGSWGGWLRQRALAKRKAAALDKTLEDLFARVAPKAPTRQVLDLLGEYDAEKEQWFAKAGSRPMFERLKKEWPDFKDAAEKGRR